MIVWIKTRYNRNRNSEKIKYNFQRMNKNECMYVSNSMNVCDKWKEGNE